MLAASVFSWQDNLFEYQPVLQWGISVCLVLFALKQLILAPKTRPAWTIALSEEGQWSDLLPLSSRCWQLSGKSLVSPWYVWLLKENPEDTSDRHWQLIFKGQLSDADFRRLNRIVLRLREMKTTGVGTE